MKQCPRCGRTLDSDFDVCLNCGYKNRKGRKMCPECGDLLIKGVCYRCGYRKKQNKNTCPYCKQKLIKGSCERCNYKRGEAKRILLFFLILLIGLLIAFNRQS